MKKEKSNSGLRAEVIFAICIFVFYLGWMIVQPFGVAPDESMRYDIPMFIFQNGRLPIGPEPALLNNAWGISYAFNPIFSYMISFVFMKVVSIFTMDAMALLYAARMVSVLCGVGTAFLALKIGKKLFGGKLAWLFACIVAFLPQMAFITSYVNNDCLAMFSTALIVYFWIRGIETKWNVKTCVGLAVSISLCALSYYNAYGFILCSLFIYFASYFLCDKDKQEYPVKDFLKKGFMIVGIVLILAGWWFIRNAILYNGDFLARKAVSECAEIYAEPACKPSMNMTFQKEGRSVFEMLFTTKWIGLTAGSFIGWFGAMEIKLKVWMYGIFGLIIGLGFLLSLTEIGKSFALKCKGVDKVNKLGIFVWIMGIAMIIPNVLNVIYSYGTDFQPQGRYSLPMLIPFAFFITLGFRKLLCSKENREYPKGDFIPLANEGQSEETCLFPSVQNKKQETITVVVTAVYVVTSILSYLLVFVPAYIK